LIDLGIYLQFIKKDFYHEEQNTYEHRQRIRGIIYVCFNNGLLLMAPFIPFYSEEFYQHLQRESNDSILKFEYPQAKNVSISLFYDY
jgi:isoleucyl-tRNA synthetase